MKKNYRLTISYDGTRYQGWQKQKKTGQTIQGKLEELLKRMIAEEETSGLLCEKPQGSRLTDGGDPGNAEMKDSGHATAAVQVIGAGRTDAGVHAKAMTANVFLDTRRSESELRAYMNRYLPEDICVEAVSVCSDRFHSRFQAIGKTYCYTCYVGNGKPVFDRKYVTVLTEGRPDPARMKQAADLLIGNHDFKAFCGNPKMKKPTVRRLDSIEIIEEGPYLKLIFRGNGFLQNMVRILTGTLLDVGFGRIAPEEIPGILQSLDRTKAGPTAPAQGLCLERVHYD